MPPAGRCLIGKIKESPMPCYQRALHKLVAIGGLYIKKAVGKAGLETWQRQETEFRLETIGIRGTVQVVEQELACVFIIYDNLVGEIVPKKFDADRCLPVEQLKRLIQADTVIPCDLGS